LKKKCSILGICPNTLPPIKSIRPQADSIQHNATFNLTLWHIDADTQLAHVYEWLAYRLQRVAFNLQPFVLIEAHPELAESNHSDYDTFVGMREPLGLYEAGLFRRLQKSKGNKTTP